MAELAPCAYPDKHADSYWRLEGEGRGPRYSCGVCHPYPWRFARVCWLDTREVGFDSGHGRMVLRIGGIDVY